jgi:serine/threonine protein kinase
MLDENHLPKGYQLENYIIERVLGEGGFGITYLATDINLKTKVVIKEFLPREFSSRHMQNQSVMPYTTVERDGTYSYLLKKFIAEAQILASIRHPNVVRVFHFFETNNTAYFVMDYIDGVSLKRYLYNKKTLSLDKILTIIMPILEGLKEVHSKNYLHRDIAPDNIYLRKNGMAMLIDFGAAKNATREESSSLAAIVKSGYSAPEQYVTTTKHTPATDIYALGSVLYSMISNKVAPESIKRQIAVLKKEPDPIGDIIGEYKKEYPKKLLKVIKKAINLEDKDRFQNVTDMQEAIAKIIPNPNPKPSNNLRNISILLLLGGASFVGYRMYSTPTIAKAENNISKDNNKKDTKKIEEDMLNIINKNINKTKKEKEQKMLEALEKIKID